MDASDRNDEQDIERESRQSGSRNYLTMVSGRRFSRCPSRDHYTELLVSRNARTFSAHYSSESWDLEFMRSPVAPGPLLKTCAGKLRRGDGWRGFCNVL